MKTTSLVFLITFAMISVSCEKAEYENSATITGADMAMCACCGGYFIEIEGTKYRFGKSELPSDFPFEDKQLPLEVELNWKLKTDQCAGFKWISISKIERK